MTDENPTNSLSLISRREAAEVLGMTEAALELTVPSSVLPTMVDIEGVARWFAKTLQEYMAIEDRLMAPGEPFKLVRKERPIRILAVSPEDLDRHVERGDLPPPNETGSEEGWSHVVFFDALNRILLAHKAKKARPEE